MEQCTIFTFTGSRRTYTVSQQEIWANAHETCDISSRRNRAFWRPRMENSLNLRGRNLRLLKSTFLC